MCAIAGIINSINDNRISQMLSVMNHRGPDFSKYIQFGNSMLGHNRLSIIDLDTEIVNVLNEGNLAVVSDSRKQKVPAYIFGAEKWSEFAKTWQYTDIDKNIKLPFIITDVDDIELFEIAGVVPAIPPVIFPVTINLFCEPIIIVGENALPPANTLPVILTRPFKPP